MYFFHTVSWIPGHHNSSRFLCFQTKTPVTSCHWMFLTECQVKNKRRKKMIKVTHNHTSLSIFNELWMGMFYKLFGRSASKFKWLWLQHFFFFFCCLLKQTNCFQASRETGEKWDSHYNSHINLNEQLLKTSAEAWLWTSSKDKQYSCSMCQPSSDCFPQFIFPIVFYYYYFCPLNIRPYTQRTEFLVSI